MKLKSLENRFSLVDDSLVFKLKSENTPAGDQPRAIEKLTHWLSEGIDNSVLLGVTGSGKTFTMANVIQNLNRPALVLAHNKTLAAQLYSEFKELFPDNAVRYFVSYYDYYQPEAYVASSDTYIEKDASINDEIDKLRHGATKALFERRDVIIVASVSCIYGLGAPENYYKMMLYLHRGDTIDRNDFLRSLVELRYDRNDVEFRTGTFRVRGDVVEICPASESEKSVRIEFFEDEVEEVSEIDKLTGKVIKRLDKTCIYPASHYVTEKEDIERAIDTIKSELDGHLKVLERSGKVLESHRLEQRTLYDLELLGEMGFCPGIENYSRHINGRKAGEAPPTLIDYFPEDTVVFIDESHVTTPQLVGMYRGDQSRKKNLVEYGFRLPSAVDNRPLSFEEFNTKVGQIVYVSATPADYELKNSGAHVAHQVIRPTGLLDPIVEVKPAGNQVDDLLGELNEVVDRGERVLVTTLTKKMSEDLTEYYREVGVRVRYLHSDIDTLERVELIKGLREGAFDVLVGINLLREGLDLPEVSLVAILDADKEGFLRSRTSLIQTMGRAARNINGRVILYADRITDSMKAALDETERRRSVQEKFNKENDITPRTVNRAPDAQLVEVEQAAEAIEGVKDLIDGLKELPRDTKSTKKIIDELRVKMFAFAKAYEFEKAAVIRDRIAALEKYMLSL